MNAQQFNYNAVAPADYYDWRKQRKAVTTMAAWTLVAIHPDRGAARVAGTGERPGRDLELLSAHGGECGPCGRTFTESEIVRTEMPSCLRGNLFERRFGGKSSDRRQAIHLDGKPYTVIGMLLSWFTVS